MPGTSSLSYGRDVHVTDPLGDALVLNGASDDLYGYRVNAPVAADPRRTVSPHRFADPLGPYGPSRPSGCTGPGAVQLGFTTTEPVDDLVDRLAAAGVKATVRRDEFVTMATITDPDGQQVQIREA